MAAPWGELYTRRMTSVGPTVNATPQRKYDKGDRRTKHVHTSDQPAIVQVGGNPKLVIGKCPNRMSNDLLQQLVNEAIPAPNAQPDLSFHKRIYVVHEGAIYEAQSSDQGHSYHGYPYKGRLSSSIINSLKQMATQKNCSKELDNWIKKYIETHGR